MTKENNIQQQFQKHLGELFYAIAASDNTIRDKEISAVQELVTTYWFAQELLDNDSNSKEQNAIINTFKTLCKNKEHTPENSYKNFIHFKKQNESFFTEAINALILKTARKIAASFSGNNKSELILLAKLSMALNK